MKLTDSRNAQSPQVPRKFRSTFATPLTVIALGTGFAACGSEDPADNNTVSGATMGITANTVGSGTTTGAANTTGIASTGSATAFTSASSSASGGMTTSAGMTTSGGMTSTTGMTPIGGMASSNGAGGGSGTMGTSGSTTGAMGAGGTGMMGAANTTGEQSSTTGGDGTCQKGTTSGNEVVFIGESFIAASSIPEDTTALARENGSLPQGESYLDFSVSGTRLGDGAIPRQYTNAAASNPIRFVLMDGGGNDCLQAGDPNSPLNAAESLFEEMAQDGVEKIVYFFYPDPAGQFASGGLKPCLDELRPQMKALCDGLTAPKCYWLDLRETSWSGNESAYTSDGIHPNAQGSQVTAEAIWGVMVENCVAQ